MDGTRVTQNIHTSDINSNIGPATPAGNAGFTVFILCFCAALIMLTIKLGMVLFG
jgi:hypothetical protein